MNYSCQEIVREVLVIGFLNPTILDPISVSSISEELEYWADDTECRKIVIDFDGVSLLSSEFLGCLVGFRNYCQIKGISLKLAAVPRDLRHLLEITNLESQFKVYRSRKSAIEMFDADSFVIRQRFFAAYAAEESTSRNMVRASAKSAACFRWRVRFGSGF